MTLKEREKSDRRVLWIVAGGVTAAAVAIAMLAGMSAQYGEEKERITRSRAAPVIREPAPASPAILAREVRSPSPAAAVDPVEVLESGPTAESVSDFAIDPEANPMREGLDAFESGEFDRAAAYFEAEVTARPERAYSHYVLGLALWKAGDFEQAEAALVRAVKLNDGSLKSWVNLARVRNDLGSFDEAQAAARRAVELDDASAQAHFLLARSLYNAGDPVTALEELRATLIYDPDMGYAHNLVGLIHLESGRVEQAETAFARAVEILPGVAYVQNNFGMALELSGRIDDAVLAYRRAVEADPGHVKSAANLVRLGPLEKREILDSTEQRLFVATTEPGGGDEDGSGTQ